MKQALVFAALICSTGTAAYAEAPAGQNVVSDPDSLHLSGSVRLRYEALDGQPRAGLRDADEQLDLRTILGAEYTRGAVKAVAELHDSRAWLHREGSPISANEINTLELVQGYVAASFDDPFGQGGKFAIQAGRMTLNLGSRRLVSSDDYRNATNGYTGVRVDLQTADNLTATAIYVLPHIRLPDDLPSIRAQKPGWDRESFDFQLWGGLVARPNTIAKATLELGYFGLLERDWQGHPTRNRDLDNYSARLIRNPRPGQFDFEIEGVYQAGSIRTSASPTAPKQEVSAYFLHADAGYTLRGSSKIRLSVEYDSVSGDAPGGKFGRFDTLFGMRGGDFAQSGIYNAIGRANLSSIGFRAELPPVARWEAYGTYRAMWLAEKTDFFSTTGVRDAAGQSGNFAGNQFEVQIRYWIIPKLLRAQLNGVYLAKGEFLRTAPNAPNTGNTKYIATALTAQF